ncbi:MAG: hypothetical protein KDK48_04375 [Chlamydiia bacterium]|nr:hypothetical protein [Chlamydiia bacterium]
MLLTALLATLAMPLIAYVATGYFYLPPLFHPMDDLFGWGLEEVQQKRERLFYSRWTLPLAATAATFLLFPWRGWEDENLRIWVTALCFIIAWRAATQDIDLSEPKPHLAERLLILLLVPAVTLYPGFLFLFLFIALVPLRSWEHHTFTTLRLLMLFLGVWIVGGGSSTVLFLALAATALPYVRAGIGKLQLSRDWPLANPLELLPLTAWLWGWRPFSAQTTLKISHLLRPLRFPLQLGNQFFEIGFALVLFHPGLALGFLAASLFFHFIVFLLGGILFWQSFLTNLATLLWILSASDATLSLTFGWVQGFAGIGWIAFALSWKKAYHTKSLAWWMTPSINRIWWVAEGTSGALYAVTNDYLDPHERLFGQSLPHNLSPKIATKHIGETKNRPLAERLNALQNDPDALKAAMESHFYNPLKGNRLPLALHFFEQFFTHYNRGVQKRVCPWWVKAPLGQIFNRAPWTVFQGQEKIKALHWIYRIDAFTESGPIVLHEEKIRTQFPELHS